MFPLVWHTFFQEFNKYHESQQTNGLDTNLYYLVGNAALITLRDMCRYLLPCAVLLFSGWQIIEILKVFNTDSNFDIMIVRSPHHPYTAIPGQHRLSV